MVIDGLDRTSVRGFCGRGGRGPDTKAPPNYLNQLLIFQIFAKIKKIPSQNYFKPPFLSSGTLLPSAP